MIRLGLALVLCGCGSSAGLEDAGTEAGPRRVILAAGGAADNPLELAQADAGAELQDAALDAGELELLEDAALDAGELAQADAAEAGALVDAGPCDGAPINGCGGCETLAYPPGTSCAGDFVGTCGICNWAFQCVYECTAPATTVRVCPNGLESCDGRP